MSRNSPNLPNSDKFAHTNLDNVSETLNEEHVSSAASATDDDDDDFGQIPIRPRQRFTSEETNRLEQIYQQYERPSAQVKQELANDMNTTVSRIQIWFQNRRAKAKKVGPSSEEAQADHYPDHIKRKTSADEDQDSPNPQSTSSASSPFEKHTSVKMKRRKSKSKKELSDAIPLEAPILRPPPTSPGATGAGAASYPIAFSAEFLTQGPLPNESSVSNPRFVHHRNPELYYKFYPFGTRVFQEVPAAYQSIPPGYYPPYMLPHYEEIAPMERTASNVSSNPPVPGLNSYIDPQKMSYARENEATTSSKPLSYTSVYSELQENEDESRGYSKKKGKMPDQKEK